jgi:hypothetical protein
MKRLPPGDTSYPAWRRRLSKEAPNTHWKESAGTRGKRMKAHWTSEDFFRMLAPSLTFADEDVYLIHQGLEWRRNLPPSQQLSA